MPRARDLLYRFRPAGAPGVAGPTGVPVDRSADANAELEHVLRSLAETERACDALLAQAQQDAERITAHAQSDEARLVREAVDRAESERAAATAAALDGARQDREALLAAAAQEAAQMHRHGQDRLEGYVRNVVASVSALLDTPVAVVPGRTGGR